MSVVECRICLDIVMGANIISVQAKIMDEKNVIEAIEEVASLEGSPDDFFPQYVCKTCFNILKSTITFRRLIIASYSKYKKKRSNDQVDKNIAYGNSGCVELVNIENEPEMGIEFKIEADLTPGLRNPLGRDWENEELKTALEETVKKGDAINIVDKDAATKSFSNKPKSKRNRIFKIRKKDVDLSHNTPKTSSLSGKVVKGKQEYNANMKMHNNQIPPPPLIYVCSICPKKFAHKKYLLVHRRSHTGEKPFHCDICNKNFSQFASFYVHKRRLHDKVIQGTCNHCGKKFVDKPELDVHIKMWHTEKRDETNVKENFFQCTGCTRHFNKKCALISHEKSCEKILKCDRCNQIFQRTYNLNRHRNRCLGKPNCKVNYCALCNFSSPTTKVLKQHYNASHNAGIVNKQCNFKTWEEFMLWKTTLEIETKSRYIQTVKYRKKQSVTYRYVCHRDGYYKPQGKGIRNVQLLDSYKINGHCPAKILADLGENGSVNVIYCDAHIGHDFEIRKFYIGSQIGERPYLCEFCSATFVCNRTLQRHRREIHSEKKPCHICGKMLGDYALKKHLVRHQVLEQGLKIIRKKYTCEYCKSIMNFTSRRRHLEKQHGIKLYGRGDDCKEVPIKETTEST